VPDRRRAWARALYLAAPDGECASAYADSLDGLRSAVERDGRIRNFLSDPSIPKAAKASILIAAYGGAGRGAAVFERFCGLIVEKGRISLVPQIARSYGELRDADEGIARLDVEAARELADDTLRRIAAAWTVYAGVKTTRAQVRVNPALIAGYRLRAGSLRIDYSIAGRLERLRRELVRPFGKSSGMPEGASGAARGEG
jgi:F-type H+-transporting ATPase subunit delta